MATRNAPMTTQATATKFGNFKPMVGTTNLSIPLHILETDANHPKSMRLLDEAGLRPLKHQEALLLLMKDEELKNQLKGKWFYLAGTGLDQNGIYTVDEIGELAEIKDKNISIENRVRAWKGKYPLSLVVNSDDGASNCGGRFVLDADDGPVDVAPVVVGVPKESVKLEPKQKASDQLARHLRLEEGQILEIPEGKILRVTTRGGSFPVLLEDISEVELLEKK